MDRDAHELARALMGGSARLAVVGGGWAGLAAAVEATLQGAAVTLFDMAPQWGGRARRVDVGGMALDNGQHIMIGAYHATLRLMREVGVDIDAAFLRTPLCLVDPAGNGLSLRAGSPVWAFIRGVLTHRAWSIGDRCAVIAAAFEWGMRRFRCSDLMTVDELTAHLPAGVRCGLIEPLCVAALNTPARAASARVFLRVLRDALFTGRGSADLLLPQRRLSELFPRPAAQWLAARGATLRLGTRVDAVERLGKGWTVDGEPFDQVVIATTAVEAARLLQPIAPGWAATAASLCYEPIMTIYAQSDHARLPRPMLTLSSDEHRRPAQFVFDLGQLGAGDGVLAFVVSGARPWLERGIECTEMLTLAQGDEALSAHLRAPLKPVRTLTEKRATFACTPGLKRPGSLIDQGLHAAGDYVEGPYPATIEGAVRSGVHAARSAITSP